MTRALLLFTRSPEAEARAKGLGPNAVPLFRAFFESWVRLAERTGTPLVVAAPPACRLQLERAGRSTTRFLSQTGRRFGDRLAGAVRQTFEGGARSVVVVGTDAPAISADTLRRAFEAAESGAVALGPAADGGLYLLALGPADAELCRGIRVRDARAFARVARGAARQGRRVRRLGRRHEIDRRADAARARRDPRWRPYGFLLAMALRRAPLAAGNDGTSCRAGNPRLAAPRAPPRAA